MASNGCDTCRKWVTNGYPNNWSGCWYIGTNMWAIERMSIKLFGCPYGYYDPWDLKKKEE